MVPSEPPSFCDTVVLANRLHPGDIAALAPNAHFVWFTEFQERFDQWMAAQRRGAAPPDMRLDVPESIRAILGRLRRCADDPNAVRIALALLDLSSAHLRELAAIFADVRLQRPTPGMFRRVVRTLGDTALAVTVTDTSVEALRRRTAERARLEHYRRRVRRSIAFGVRLDSREVFDARAFVDAPWAFDPALEREIQEERLVLAPGQKLPGRNDPCVCGSGRKFKRCCLPKLDRGR